MLFAAIAQRSVFVKVWEGKTALGHHSGMISPFKCEHNTLIGCCTKCKPDIITLKIGSAFSKRLWGDPKYASIDMPTPDVKFTIGKQRPVREEEPT